MADTQYGYDDFLHILDDFKEGQTALSNIQLIIVGGENELDPEELLRFYQSQRSLSTSKELATKLVTGKEVIIKSTTSGKEVVHFKFVGGDITLHFRQAPYALEQFYGMCHGIVLKKLTPPSSDFQRIETSLGQEQAALSTALHQK